MAIKEKFTSKQRLLSIALLAIVLPLAYFYPNGIIRFEKFEDKDVLVAEREGSANCTTIFKLKENNKFIERNVCFSVTEIKGTYKLKGDTIFFENVEFGIGETEYYKFAVIKPSQFSKDGKSFDLIRYKDFSDTIGHKLWVNKNDL